MSPIEIVLLVMLLLAAVFIVSLIVSFVSDARKEHRERKLMEEDRKGMLTRNFIYTMTPDGKDRIVGSVEDGTFFIEDDFLKEQRFSRKKK